jgi:hypothetical protein
MAYEEWAMTYTVRYDFGGDAKEVCGLSPERAKALCLELAAMGIATRSIVHDQHGLKPAN